MVKVPSLYFLLVKPFVAFVADALQGYPQVLPCAQRKITQNALLEFVQVMAMVCWETQVSRVGSEKEGLIPSVCWF